MATWAIGDVHGCHQTLVALVARLDLVAGRDRLWLVGDVVNRGRGSLATLAWLHARRHLLVMVLGNHDLRLLMRWHGVARPRPDDTLEAILAHPNRRVWLTWLAARPLLHVEGAHVLVHAGLLPAWRLADVEADASAASQALAGRRRHAFLVALAAAARGPAGAGGLDGLAARVRTMTQVRMVDAAGEPVWGHVGRPAAAPAGLKPWFADLDAAGGLEGRTVVFGHWSGLGLWRGAGALGLDTGCVWGRALTAWRLEDGHSVVEPCHPDDGPRRAADGEGGRAG